MCEQYLRGNRANCFQNTWKHIFSASKIFEFFFSFLKIKNKNKETKHVLLKRFQKIENKNKKHENKTIPNGL